MSRRDQPYHSDTILFIVVTILIVASVYWLFPPFRYKVNALQLGLYSLEVRPFNSELSLQLRNASKILLKASVREIAAADHARVDYIVSTLKKEAISYVRWYAVAIWGLLFVYFLSRRADPPSMPLRSGYMPKISLRELLQRKYCLNIDKTTSASEAAKLLRNAREERNIPPNLVARLFSKDKDRITIYRGEDYTLTELKPGQNRK